MERLLNVDVTFDWHMGEGKAPGFSAPATSMQDSHVCPCFRPCLKLGSKISVCYSLRKSASSVTIKTSIFLTHVLGRGGSDSLLAVLQPLEHSRYSILGGPQ